MATREIGTSLVFSPQSKIAFYPGAPAYKDFKILQFHAENVAVAGETIISKTPIWQIKDDTIILWAFICINVGLPVDAVSAEAIMDGTLSLSDHPAPIAGLWCRHGYGMFTDIGYETTSVTYHQFYGNLWIPAVEDDYIRFDCVNNQVSGPAATDNYGTFTADVGLLEKR
jgi:hypothetical protein